ncbi:MAG: DUF4174 domain-containing protein [Saprospiraceae bacterium]|nr:DUF4174 domain-containing protein [Saprospiraceae bacterium]
MRSFLVIFFLIFSYSTSMAQSLKQHQWKDRIILIFAESTAHPLYQEQQKLLQSNEIELKDRDLVVYRLFKQKAIEPGGEVMTRKWADQVTKKYNRAKKPFFFVLLGKDGGMKLLSDEVVAMQQLFGLIDSMPMRRAEMKEKGNK